MNPDIFANLLGPLLVAAIIGLVTAHFALRRDLSEFKEKVAEKFITNEDMASVKVDMEKIKDEVKSILEMLYEIRADLRAGNLQKRT